MRRPSVVVLIAFLSLGAVALPARGEAGAKRPAAKTTQYTAREVRQAFTAARDPLFDTGFGALASPVTVLSTVKALQGWTATVYIYPNAVEAGLSYRGNLESWHASGVAAAQLKNLVVAVSRQGSSGSQGTRSPPLPPPVAKAVAILRSQRR